MIDPELLRQLGWSNDLIDAAIQAAEPMRRTASRASRIEPFTGIQSISCSAMYGDSVINNTLRELSVVQPGSMDRGGKKQKKRSQRLKPGKKL
jgi:hypothetical protein